MKSLILILLAASAFAKDLPDPKLVSLKTVFVSGNNEAAEKIRQEIESDSKKGKSCFALAINPKDADGTLEIASDSARASAGLGFPDRERSWVINGILTLRSGDQVWSGTGKFSDAPFSSGAKTAGHLVYRQLRKAACGN